MPGGPPAPAASLALLFALLPLSAANAHTVVGRALDGKAAIAEFRFSNGEPMAYAEVKVFAPGGTEAFQVGRTDGTGRFAFVPDQPGDWRVEAHEEAENHGARLLMKVSSDFAVSVQLNRFWTLLLWLSAALNIVLVAVVLDRRQKQKALATA